jgi:hypothetical protein
MKKYLPAFIIFAWVLLLASACKNGVPSPQKAIGASVRLISVSPKPIGLPDPNRVPAVAPLPLQSQLSQ